MATDDEIDELGDRTKVMVAVVLLAFFLLLFVKV